MEKNLQYALADGAFVAFEIKGKKLKNAKNEASMIIRHSKRNVFLTKCWLCDEHKKDLLKGDWNQWVLQCYKCGRWYYKKIDITEHEKKGQSNGNKPDPKANS